MFLENLGLVLQGSFYDLWAGVVAFVPQLILAVLIFIIGWILGGFVSHLVEQLFKSLKIDSFLRTAGVEEAVSRSGFKLNSGAFVGKLVEWFVILVFLVASFDVLGLSYVTKLLSYIVTQNVPQVIIAVLIVIATFIIAELVSKVVTGSAKAAGIAASNFAGVFTRWAIWIFGFILALSQVGIGGDYLIIFFQGVVVAFALGLGLSFGLGGQDAAAEVIAKVRGEISHTK